MDLSLIRYGPSFTAIALVNSFDSFQSQKDRNYLTWYAYNIIVLYFLVDSLPVADAFV